MSWPTCIASSPEPASLDSRPDPPSRARAPRAPSPVPSSAGVRRIPRSRPAGPYIVFDSAGTAGVPLSDYVAAPVERSVFVVTPAMQYTRDSVVRDMPVTDLPPVFPTPLHVTHMSGGLRLDAMPAITAAPELVNEARFATECMQPYFKGGKGTGGVRLETGTVEGQSSPEAYDLTIDPVAGIRIVGASSAGVFYGLQTLRGLLPAPAQTGGVTLAALHVVDAPRFGYRGFMLDVARNFHPKGAVLRTLDLMARYKLNVLHMH